MRPQHKHGVVDSKAAAALGSVSLARAIGLTHDGACSTTHGGADRPCDDGAGDGSGRGSLFDGVTAGGERQGGSDQADGGDRTGHGEFLRGLGAID